MAVIDKTNFKYPTDGVVTFKDTQYIADKLILFPITKDIIDFDNCTCVFSILERPNLQMRQYVGAKFYENLNNENAIEEINGYLPEHIFCFIKTNFPLQDFIDDKNFKRFVPK